jgi:hypothetical protein
MSTVKSIQFDLYAKLAEAEARIADGEKCEDFDVAAQRMRKSLLGKNNEWGFRWIKTINIW